VVIFVNQAETFVIKRYIFFFRGMRYCPYHDKKESFVINTTEQSECPSVGVLNVPWAVGMNADPTYIPLVFPKSDISIDRSVASTINAYNLLIKTENADCGEALKRIYGIVDMERIRAFLNGVPYISDLQKQFYDRYITARLDFIIRPAYEIVMSYFHSDQSIASVLAGFENLTRTLLCYETFCTEERHVVGDGILGVPFHYFPKLDMSIDRSVASTLPSPLMAREEAML